MLSFITGILGLIPGLFGTINSITNAIANEKIASVNATTEQERIAANERISALQARQAVLIAESGSRWNSFVRAILALGPTVVLLKLFIWDKVIGSFVGCAGPQPHGVCQTFVTDPLDDHQWYVITATIAFYFLYEGAKVLKR